MKRSVLVSLISCLACSFQLSAQIADGIASFYGDRFHGQSTSTGETFDMNAYTCAAKVFPYGTILKVTNKANGRFTQVRVNDCGPQQADRIVDLSSGAARIIGIGPENGLAEVRVEVLSLGTEGPTCSRGAWSRAGRPAFQLDLSNFPVVGNLPASSTAAPSSSTVRPNSPTNSTTRGVAPPTAPAGATIRPPVAPTAPTVRGGEPAQAPATQATPPAAPSTYSPPISIQQPKEEEISTSPAQASPSTYSPPVKIEQPEPPVTPAPAPEVEASPAASSPAASDNTLNREAAPLYAVQTGAFGNLENANSMIERLKEAGFEGAIAIKGGNIYRVFSKPVNFRAQAEYWKEKLATQGFNGSIRRIR